MEHQREAKTNQQKHTQPSPSPALQLRAPVHPILQLQQTIGNRAVKRLFDGAVIQRQCGCGNSAMAGGECSECSKKKRLGLQTKLKVNEPRDIYEQEADRITDQHRAVSDAPSNVQRISGQSNGQVDAAPPSVDWTLASPGSPLDPELQQDMGQRFGYDFSGVRVHVDGEAATAARAVRARAFTAGRDIVFGAGQYAPTTRQGQRLLAHELTHVVQQGSGQPTPDIQRAPDDTTDPNLGRLALDCGSPTLKCPPNSVQINETSNVTLGTLVHNIVLEDYVTAHQRALGDENFILIDRGFGEVHTKTESSRSISRLAVLDPPVHGAFAKGAKRGERGTGTLAQRPDILDDERDTVSEIKSCTPEGRQEGRSDLVDYFSRLAVATEKVPPSGNRRKRNWRTGSWMPADFTYNQGTPTFQVVFSMPERGLILYSIWSCQPQEEREHDRPPIVIEKPTFEMKGDPKGTSETKGKGDGRPSKGDGRPGKGNGGRKAPGGPGQQPTVRLPGGVDWKTILGVLAAIASLFVAGRIGALLGMILRALGITLGVVAGAAVAAAAEPAASGTGGPPTRVPGTGGPPTGPPVPGTEPGPPRTTGAREGKEPPTTAAPTRKPPPKARVIKLDVIEGVNLDNLSKGMVVPVLLSGRSKHGVAILQVTKVVKEGNKTTAEFWALQSRLDEPGAPVATRTVGGNIIYTVTHPSDESKPTGWVGQRYRIGPNAEWFLNYLENAAEGLENAGWGGKASEVRSEVQRLRRLIQSANL